MPSAPPIVTRWNGEAFVPLGRSEKEANASRVVGELYRLTDYEERSEASHNHFFAQVAEYWATLPEQYDGRWQNPEALRKHALIATGFATQRQYVASSRAEAERVAAFTPSMDEYEIATIAGNIVTIWRAESQSYRSMGKKRFEESKAAVLGYIANLIGVSPETLTNEAGKAA